MICLQIWSSSDPNLGSGTVLLFSCFGIIFREATPNRKSILSSLGIILLQSFLVPSSFMKSSFSVCCVPLSPGHSAEWWGRGRRSQDVSWITGLQPFSKSSLLSDLESFSLDWLAWTFSRNLLCCLNKKII